MTPTPTYATGRQGNLVIHTATGMEGVTHMAWFFCPGCDEAHAFYMPRWTFDCRYEAPTFSPSLLNRRPDHVCHLFLRAGKLEFLGDCTHPLAGKTAPLPEPPEWL